MKTLQTDVLIIGAGPAGLAAAMELSKAGKQFIVLEKADAVGGLSRTYLYPESDGALFRTDNGPHRFFSKNPYLYEFIGDLLKEKWIKVERQTRQYIDGKFYDYPIKPVQALRNVGIFHAIHMVLDAVLAKLQYKILKKKITNFEEYVVANFGRTLGEFNMINYTEKIWGIPAATIHTEWASQRIKGLSLFALVKDSVRKIFFQKSADTPKSLVDAFYYPDLGTGLIYETIAEKLKSKGYQILLKTVPKKVFHQNGKITKVLATGPDGEVEISCNSLVESVPLPKFVELFSPALPEKIIDSARKLKYRSQVYLFLTLGKESITKDQWIYFPRKDIPFARISEMRNFSTKMSPEGKTSLFIEFFCFEGDEIWNMNAEQLLSLSLPHFEKMGFFSKKDVRHSYMIRQKDVYPIYDLFYHEFLDKIKDKLDEFSNLYYIGRPGRFRYNNQDHSLEMGILAARSLIDGKRYDIEAVGTEKEYFEGGKIPSEKK